MKYINFVQCVGVVGVVLGVDRPDVLGVRAVGRRGLDECVGVVTGVVGVVLAPDHPLLERKLHIVKKLFLKNQ